MKRRSRFPTKPADFPAVRVHDLTQARAAVAAARETGMPVALWSPAGAAAYLGPAYFQALVDAARAEEPEASVTAVLDCADDAGWALAAFRQGIAAVCFRGRSSVAETLAGIAREYGAEVLRKPPKLLDLAEERDPDAACRAWLARKRP